MTEEFVSPEMNLSRVKFEKYNFQQLRQIARCLNVQGRSRLNKSELIDVILSSNKDDLSLIIEKCTESNKILKRPISEKDVSEITLSPPHIPSFTSETWELIGHRLWSKFSTKLWTIIGAFLTLITIGGTLGLPAYIEAKVQDNIFSEKQKFEKLREQLHQEAEDLLLRINLTNHVFDQYKNDTFTYRMLTNALQQRINSMENKDHIKYFSEKVEFLNNFRIRPSKYNEYIEEIASEFEITAAEEENKNHRFIGAKPHWEKLGIICQRYGIEEFCLAITMYPHLASMRNTLLNNNYFVLRKYLEEESLKTKLYSEYDNSVYPEYKKIWDEFNMPFSSQASSGEYGWANLSDRSSFEFLLYEELSKKIRPSLKENKINF